MPATAYGQVCSFFSAKRYALRRDSEPAKTSAIIQIGTTTIIRATNIPKGL